MRIGFGKRIGGFYIGTSASTKEIGNGIIAILLFPFYFLYYVCIWPFVAIYHAINGASKREKANARMMANQYAKIAQDSAKLVNETKVPGVFFDRFDLLTENLSKMAAIERLLPPQKESPSAALARIEGSKAASVNAFIDRYAQETRLKMYELSTERGKKNKAEAFYNILSEYKTRMPDESVEYYTNVYEQLKILAQPKLESVSEDTKEAIK